ncbi:MAG: alkaline phosphatase family protein [Chloroflexota bacterium]|nr:alkaline phosphatase family protein [Chloroflexota bacterium]
MRQHTVPDSRFQIHELGTQIEHTLRAHRFPALEDVLPSEFILPNYEGYSIANLPATIAGLLGLKLPEAAPSLPTHLWSDLATGVRCVIIILLDAVGYVHLQHHLTTEDTFFRRLAQAGRLIPLTSVFPSTTTTALTTLWTGRTPLGHGFLGTKLLLSNQGVLANMLHLAPAAHNQPEGLLNWGWEPETFVTTPSLAGQLAAGGVQTVAHTYLPHVAGGLSRIFMRGVDSVRGYIGFSDPWINLRHTLIQHQEEPLFVSVYWGSTDSLAHIYGPEGEPFWAELRHLARSLEEDFLAPLPAAAREGTLLFITADHGHTATPPEREVRLSDHPALQQTLLLPPAGEPRAAYLYARPGQAGSLRATVAEHLSDRFLLLETERALAAGLFGPEEPTPELRARLGDFLLLARNDSRLTVEERKVRLYGHHGSLTPEEMLVPLLMARLDGL